MVHNLDKMGRNSYETHGRAAIIEYQSGYLLEYLGNSRNPPCRIYKRGAPHQNSMLASRAYASSSHPIRLAVWNVIQLLRLSVLFYRSQCTHSNLEFNSRHRACVLFITQTWQVFEPSSWLIALTVARSYDVAGSGLQT